MFVSPEYMENKSHKKPKSPVQVENSKNLKSSVQEGNRKNSKSSVQGGIREHLQKLQYMGKVCKNSKVPSTLEKSLKE